MSHEDRFAIYTVFDSGGLLNASTDENGRPGGYAELLGLDPDRLWVISVTTLPIPPDDRERYPEAFKLLITYRYEITPDPKHLASL